jgi:hypothetical protein
MDARAAEHFLIRVGCGELPPPSDSAPSATAPPRPLAERWRMAWQATCHVEQLAKVPPRILRAPNRSVPPVLKYRIEKFSADETTRIRANATRLCGFLGDAQFDASSSILELHQLHQRLGSGSPSYCFPLPVGLRPKGGTGLLFSNEVAMLMLQFFPDQLDSLPAAVTALKTQNEQALRSGLLDNGIMLSELSRCVPLSLYMAIVKYSLGGEIASLFYGDAGSVNPLLTTFLGAPVLDVAHVAAVTESPGIGVIFCRFQNQLRLSVIYASPILRDEEAAEFAANLRQRLLNP